MHTATAKLRAVAYFAGLVVLGSAPQTALALRAIAKPVACGCQSVKGKSELTVPVRKPFVIGVPVAIAAPGHAFADGKPQLAWRTDVTVGGLRVPVFTPNALGVHGGGKALRSVAKALASAPTDALQLVREVDVNATPNPYDAYWTQLKGIGVTAGMSASVDGVLSVFPHGLAQSDAVTARNVLHEIGHIWSRKSYGEKVGSGWQPWQSAVAADPAVPSRYGASDPEEDAGDATALYLLTRGSASSARYRALLPRRFAILDAVFAARGQR